jgi:hypothetical protein
VPWRAIRDDGAVVREPYSFDDVPDFWGEVGYMASEFRLDRQEGQAVSVEVWCEAAGMAPQLVTVANPFGVAVYAGGGFDSVTAKHNAAQRIVTRAVPTVILHVGDLDADGLAIADSSADDVTAFVHDLDKEAAGVEFVRVAVTEEQVRVFGLPTAPPKRRSDGQRLRGGAMSETVQAEALDPRHLADIIRTAIETHLDAAILESVLALEAAGRAELLRVLDHLPGAAG